MKVVIDKQFIPMYHRGQGVEEGGHHSRLEDAEEEILSMAEDARMLKVEEFDYATIKVLYKPDVEFEEEDY